MVGLLSWCKTVVNSSIPLKMMHVSCPPGPSGGGQQQPSWSGGQRRPNSGGQSRGIKFEGEFDFETANAKFDKEGLEDQLREKLTVGEGRDGELEEGEVPEEGSGTPGYDKNISFFDNISTETRNPESKS